MNPAYIGDDRVLLPSNDIHDNNDAEESLQREETISDVDSINIVQSSSDNRDDISLHNEQSGKPPIHSDNDNQLVLQIEKTSNDGNNLQVKQISSATSSDNTNFKNLSTQQTCNIVKFVQIGEAGLINNKINNNEQDFDKSEPSSQVDFTDFTPDGELELLKMNDISNDCKETLQTDQVSYFENNSLISFDNNSIKVDLQIEQNTKINSSVSQCDVIEHDSIDELPKTKIIIDDIHKNTIEIIEKNTEFPESLPNEQSNKKIDDFVHETTVSNDKNMQISKTSKIANNESVKEISVDNPDLLEIVKNLNDRDNLIYEHTFVNDNSEERLETPQSNLNVETKILPNSNLNQTSDPKLQETKAKCDILDISVDSNNKIEKILKTTIVCDKSNALVSEHFSVTIDKIESFIDDRTNILDKEELIETEDVKNDENFTKNNSESLRNDVSNIKGISESSKNSRTDIDSIDIRTSSRKTLNIGSTIDTTLKSTDRNNSDIDQSTVLLINKLQNMDWLKSQSSSIDTMTSTYSKVSLKSLPKKDANSEVYFEGIKKNSNSQKHATQKNQNVKSSANSTPEGFEQQGSNSPEISNSVWNATSAKQLFPNVQCVVIDRTKEEDELSLALAKSICTAQQENEKRKMEEKNWKIGVQDDNNNDDQWEKFNKNLPDNMLTIVAETNDNQNLEKGLFDKFGRVDGYSEKHMFLGKGARRKEQELFTSLSKNNSQLESGPEALHAHSTTKSFQETNLCPKIKQEFDTNKSKDKLANKNYSGGKPNKNSQQLDKNQERPIHGRSDKDFNFDSSQNKNQQKSGNKQDKDLNQNPKEKNVKQSQNLIKNQESSQNNPVQHQNHSSKNLENVNQNQEYTTKLQHNPDKYQENVNKNQDQINRQRNCSGRNYDNANKNQNFNKTQDNRATAQNITNNQGPYNRNQNYSKYQDTYSRHQNYSHYQDNYNKNQDNYYKNQNYSQNQDTFYKNRDSFNKYHNYSDGNKDIKSKNQDQFYKNVGYSNRHKEDANRNEGNYNRNQNYDSTNKSQRLHNINEIVQIRDERVTPETNPNLQRNFGSSNQQTCNQKESNYQSRRATSFSSFDQEKSLNLVENKKIDVDSANKTNLKEEQTVCITSNTLVRRKSNSSVSSSGEHVYESYDSLNPTVASSTVKKEFKQEVSNTADNFNESLNSGSRPNVVMSFDGNQNVQRVLGLDPSTYVPHTINQQNSKIEVTTSNTINPVTLHTYVNNSNMVQNDPYSQQSILCTNLSAPIHSNPMVNVNTAAFQFLGFNASQDQKSQYLSMGYYFPQDLNLPEPDRILVMQLIEKMLRESDVVANAKRYLASSEANLLATQAKIDEIRSRYMDSQLTYSNMPSISGNQTLESQSDVSALDLQMKYSTLPGFQVPVPNFLGNNQVDTFPSLQNFPNEQFCLNTPTGHRFNIHPPTYMQTSNIYNVVPNNTSVQFDSNASDVKKVTRGGIVPQDNESKDCRGAGHSFYKQRDK